MTTDHGTSDARKFLESLDGPLTIARMLESERLCEEITHAELARRLGVSRAYLCNLEQGRKLASPEQAARLAEALGEPTKPWVAVALQDQLRASGIHFRVTLEPLTKLEMRKITGKNQQPLAEKVRRHGKSVTTHTRSGGAGTRSQSVVAKGR